MSLLNISAKNHYGLIIMCALAAAWSQGQYVSLKEIAKRMSLPGKFLEEIAAQLKAADLVRAKRGAEGGYKLSKDPKGIKVRDIIQAIEGPVRVIECQAGICPKSRLCRSKSLWLFLEKSLNKTLKNTSLHQVLYKL
ncbi:Rrf2 family transcriptional regulator [Patescibacteria group bacterium]|nr:Rrf2 family transcriptional regulator [Patescibacteria group bacterium]MBU1922385.1 Rrf2 family transcriptional regulator [Patescibacteria group bacterium]